MVTYSSQRRAKKAAISAEKSNDYCVILELIVYLFMIMGPFKQRTSDSITALFEFIFLNESVENRKKSNLFNINLSEHFYNFFLFQFMNKRLPFSKCFTLFH